MTEKIDLIWVLMCAGINRLNSAGGVAILQAGREIHTQGGCSELIEVKVIVWERLHTLVIGSLPRFLGHASWGVPQGHSSGSKELDVK